METSPPPSFLVGAGSRTDQRVATILGATPGSSNPNFRWSIYYENESLGNPTVSDIQNDLQYIQSHYGSDPSFLRVNGKFVVFVYADATDGCGMADRWVQADNGLGHPAYIVLKVFAGYSYCASQPDSWHQYSPAVATDEQKGFSYAISPGFWKKGEAPRLVRDLARWTSNVRSMVASGDPWQLVATLLMNGAKVHPSNLLRSGLQLHRMAHTWMCSMIMETLSPFSHTYSSTDQHTRFFANTNPHWHATQPDLYSDTDCHSRWANPNIRGQLHLLGLPRTNTHGHARPR